MIKVIKHGQKEFNCTCPRCGCEFTYEYEDIHTEAIRGITYSYSSTSYVVCPDCKHHCEIPGKTNWYDPIPKIPFNTPSGTRDCQECDWWKKITQPGGYTYVGDTPCTWCPKNPYRTICSDSVSAMAWVRAKQCKTKLMRTERNIPLFDLIARAERWLQTNTYTNKILKWDTPNWGEIPADFGRK